MQADADHTTLPIETICVGDHVERVCGPERTTHRIAAIIRPDGNIKSYQLTDTLHRTAARGPAGTQVRMIT